MQIKNIIFDLGGVIYDIRYENLSDAIKKYGVSGLSGFYTKNFQTHEMDLFEKGLLSAAEYRDYLRKVSGLQLSDAEIDDVVNAVLLDVPKERVALLWLCVSSIVCSCSAIRTKSTMTALPRGCRKSLDSTFSRNVSTIAIFRS